jgi:hypothetical protein
MMTPLLLALSVAAPLLAATTVEPPARGLVEIVREVRSADYRGAREELAQLAIELDTAAGAELAAVRLYWRGFALWRRALNGFNETPTPDDLARDLEGAVASFRRALAADPEWVEPSIGMVGCWSSLLFLAREDAARREAILAEYVPVARAVRERAPENPRALWLTGGTQLGAPPPYGGDAARAAATFRRGLEAAIDEARRAAEGPPWEPRWGGAENLMGLAYLYSHSAINDRELALAYAHGALVAAPDWRYVREMLLPQIEALPPAAASE